MSTSAGVKRLSATTALIDCTCPHPYQDEKFGKGKRFANLAGQKGVKKWRCTVCTREVQA